jgi:transposase
MPPKGVGFPDPLSGTLNPTEQLFAKIKALLRKATARTIDALIAAIADVLTKVTPGKCANYPADQGLLPPTVKMV